MTDAESTHLLGCIRRGVSFRSACISAGVKPADVRALMRIDASLAERVAKAQADAEVVLVAQMHELAKTDHKAAAWLLSRIRPERYGTRRVARKLRTKEVKALW